jgi:ferritin-like metal-binding protein YciE
MATKKTSLVSLQDLFIIKLKSLYDIELQLIKALPKMAKNAENPDLKSGFLEHLEETKNHAKRLEDIFKMTGEKVGKTKVEAIRGMIADAEWLIDTIDDPGALDASLIGAGQAVEHYEMAGYGTAREWAKLLGLNEVEDLLNETLKEEKAADQKLNDLATETVNEEAMIQSAQM